MALTDAQAGGVIGYAGVDSVPLTLHGTVKAGDHLGHDGTGWVQGLATVGTARYGSFVADRDGVSGDIIGGYPACILRGRLSGMTAGAPIYEEESTGSGKYTETAPSTTGDINTPVGNSISATEAYLFPGFAAKKVA